MRLSNKGFELLKSLEGCKLISYQDQGGVWTIGYGHTGKELEPKLQPARISQKDADLLLRQDIEKFEDGVQTAVANHKITSGQFDALVIFSFNVGLFSLTASTLLKKFNAGDVKGAASEFMKWNKIKGKEVVGLTNRRKKEQELFLS